MGIIAALFYIMAIGILVYPFLVLFGKANGDDFSLFMSFVIWGILIIGFIKAHLSWKEHSRYMNSGEYNYKLRMMDKASNKSKRKYLAALKDNVTSNKSCDKLYELQLFDINNYNSFVKAQDNIVKARDIFEKWEKDRKKLLKGIK